ncbi:hypothetical protein FACS189429_0660 [Bacteroidia bacterium]|nr:hypothetical protein FACS189429_0660 [Bacteroidia bacterium]
MEKGKNKWKVAFWWYFAVSIVLLLFVVGYSAYTVINEAYTIAYNSDGWAWDREDKDNLAIIVNNTDYSKNQIIKELGIKEQMIENDTIFLNTLKLVFKNDTLIEIIKY